MVIAEGYFVTATFAINSILFVHKRQKISSTPHVPFSTKPESISDHTVT